MDTTVLTGGRPEGRRVRQIVSGYVSNAQPVPTSFADPLFVVVPSHSPEIPIRFDRWPAVNGSTLPNAGAAVSVGYDENGVPHVLGWDATLVVFAPSGPAGGDLVGNYPNPAIAPQSIATCGWSGGASVVSGQSNVTGWGVLTSGTYLTATSAGLKATKSGTYLFSALMQWGGNGGSGTSRGISFAVNGGTQFDWLAMPVGGNDITSRTAFMPLNANDVVTAALYQDSGTTLTFPSGGLVLNINGWRLGN